MGYKVKYLGHKTIRQNGKGVIVKESVITPGEFPTRQNAQNFINMLHTNIRKTAKIVKK